MELTVITQEIYDSTKRLNEGSKKLFALAKEKAETERDYRRALQIEIMALKEEKLAATLIPDVARGKTSDSKYERDLAEARYTSARDSLEAIKAQVNALQSILKYQSEV